MVSARRNRMANRNVPRTSREWCDHFYANVQKLYPIPWEDGVVFKTEERAAIAASIATFQLGESGTGRHILREAERYAARTGDVDYPAALKLFFAEEHRHAQDLGRVLDLAGLPRIERHWSDGVFRGLRHLTGLEAAISILLTPELIAKIYYAALREATAAPVLRRLCEQILKDEAMHVRFQTERLALLRRKQPRWRVRLSQFAQCVFFAGACGAFWISHARTMCAGGFGWRRFWRRAANEWGAASKLMDPERYRFSMPEPDGRPICGEGVPAVRTV